MRATSSAGGNARSAARTTDVDKKSLILIAALLLLTAAFVMTAAANLGNYWPVNADDVWIISASYKWATQGIFGSDLYAGFFNAERHYFIALPVQHVLQALVFHLVGPSIEAARWVSLAAAVGLLWTTAALAWRWFGATAALFSALLLVFWRSGLVGSASIPLLHLSRTARYDLMAVTLMWLAILLAAVWLEQPRRRWALAAGFAAGTALLTQFFAAAVVPILAAVWLWGRFRLDHKHLPVWFALGLLLPLLPYAIYLQQHWADAVGQTLYLKGFRLTFSPPELLQNLAREWQRFRHLPELGPPSAGPWLLLLLIPALLHLLWPLCHRQLYHRQRRHKPRSTEFVLALVTGMTALFLALFDVTKAPLYAAPLLPALCLLLGRFLAVLYQDLCQHQAPLRTSAVAVTLFLVLVPLAEGLAFHAPQRHVARTITPYSQVAGQIRSALPPDARAAGSERWWWQLRDTPYLAMNVLWLEWQIALDEGRQPASFASIVAGRDLTHFIVNDDVRGDINRRHPELQEQFRRFLEQCATAAVHWQAPTYGLIVLHQIQPACTGQALDQTISNLHSSNLRSP